MSNSSDDRIILNLMANIKNLIASSWDAVSGVVHYSSADILPQTSPSLQNGVCIPQRRFGKGASHDHPTNQNLVLFIRQDGSYIPLTAAMGGDFTGLVNRDTSAFDMAGFTITLRFEVNRPNLPWGCWYSLIPQWPGYSSQDFQAS